MLSSSSSVWPFTFLNFSTGSFSPWKHSYSQVLENGLWRLLRAHAVAAVVVVEVAAAVEVQVLDVVIRDVVVDRTEEQYPGLSPQTEP